MPDLRRDVWMHLRSNPKPQSLIQTVRLGNAWIMVRIAREGQDCPARLGYETQCLTVFVGDADGHFQRAKPAGPKILEEPHETEYGEYQFAVKDLDGHHWLFSRHAPNVRPVQWGAKVAEGTSSL